MTSYGCQKVQVNQHVLSVFNKSVLAILIFGPLVAWFVFIDTIDIRSHSMCSYRNRLTNRPENQTPLFPNFDHVPGLNGTATSVIDHSIPLNGIFSKFYTVNMVFGNYSFTVVKAIDIVWDIIVGRGGQALLLYVLSQVFYEVLHMLLEKDSMVYDTFASLSLSGPTAWGLWMLGRDLFSTAQRKKAWFITMGVSLLWVLFFPTVMSVMTGYIALSAPYVKMDDKALMPWYDFTLRWSEQPAARVADGDRIGLQPNQVIFKSDDEQIYKTLQNCMLVSLFQMLTLRVGLITHLFSRTFTDTYFFYYCPSIGVRESYCDPSIDPLIINGTTYNLTSFQPRLKIKLPCQVYDGGVYCEEDFMSDTSSRIQCKGKDTYAWGFSESFLTMTVSLHTVWCLGLLTMHHLATRRPRVLSSQQQRRSGTRLGVIRGSCDLAYAVEEKLGRERAQMSDDGELVRELSALCTRLRYRHCWESGDDGARVTTART